MKSKILKAHLALLMAGAMWGLMSPLGKLAMDAGFSRFSLIPLRMIGAALCFWIASLFAPREKVKYRDYLLLFFASLFCIVLNQGVFIVGLSLTSPSDATIIATLSPIITLVLAYLFLKESITLIKLIGVLMGAMGVLILILGGRSGSGGQSSALGNLLCLISQISFVIYLTFFKGLICRYNVFTLMKWMFTFATICILPFSYPDLKACFEQNYPFWVWGMVFYVVVFATFLTYLFVVEGQKQLSPTIVSIYTYIQPVVSILVSVFLGLANYGIISFFASTLVFAGVYLVIQNKFEIGTFQKKKSI